MALPERVDSSNLPYADFLTNEKLKKMDTTRSNTCGLFWRGDNRCPQEIATAGGFHPKCLQDGMEWTMRSPDAIFDVDLHSFETKGSGLVSLTLDRDVAKGICKNLHGFDYYAYLVKAIGTLSPSCGTAKFEKEYCVPGGLDYENIVSYRQYYKKSPYITCSITNCSIFVSKKFISNYPELVEKVLDVNLQEDEVINKI